MLNIKPFFDYYYEQGYSWEVEEVKDPEFVLKAVYTISNPTGEEIRLTLGTIYDPKKIVQQDDGKFSHEVTVKTELFNISMGEKECKEIEKSFTFYTGIKFNVIN